MGSDPMDDLHFPDDDELWRERVTGSPKWESRGAKIAALTVERDELKAELDALICECRDGTIAALVCGRCGQLLPEGNTCSSSLHVGPGEDDFGPSSGDPIASTDLATQRDEAIRERDTAQRHVERWAAEAREAIKDRVTLLKAIAGHRQNELMGYGRRLYRAADEIAERTGYAGGQGDG